VSGLDVFFTVAVLTILLVAFGHMSKLIGAMGAGGVRESDVDLELIELVDRKAHLLEDLRDTELDFRMGKISEEDYLRRKRIVEPEAVAVMKALEARGYGISDEPADPEDDEDFDDEDLDDEDLDEESANA